MAPSLAPWTLTLCEDCGAPGPRVSLGGVSLCDRCSDRRVAAITGYPELPDAPQPIQVADGDGRLHLLEYRVWRAPTGIEVELERGRVRRGVPLCRARRP